MSKCKGAFLSRLLLQWAAPAQAWSLAPSMILILMSGFLNLENSHCHVKGTWV